MNLNVKSWEAFLYAVVDGPINARSVERLLKLTAATAARKGISKILIDGRGVTGSLSAVKREEVAEKLANYLNQLGARPNVAFIGHPPTYNGLGVAVARGHGVNVTMFNKVHDALAWLLRQRSHEKRPAAA